MRGSRPYSQQIRPRFLPAATKPMSEKRRPNALRGAAGKTTLFASGNEADVRKTAAQRAPGRSWQKPRFLPAATKPMSEKRPQAVFLMNKCDNDALPGWNWEPMRRSADPDARHVKVRLKHLHLQRHGRVVLEDVSWTIQPGQRWVLAGGNGAGKTQLLKIIAGAVWPTAAGTQQAPSAVAHPSRRYHWRNETFLTPMEVKEEIAYVGPERQDKYERYGWNHTVEEVVGTGLYRTDIPLNTLTPEDRRRIAALLARLALTALRHRTFLSLSYGERRLTLLARALASGPKLLLMDELLGGLDSTNHDRALHWINRTTRSNLPWILATHRIEDVPASATHGLVLEKGRVVYRGTLPRAPLQKWLESADPHPALSVSRRGTGRVLLRLTGASVYIDEQRILEGLSLEVRSGECWVVHGHNGSGKTTLLRTLYGDHAVAVGGRIERAGIEPGVPLQEFKRKVGIVAPHLQAEHPQGLTVAAVVQSGRHASIGLNDPPTVADRAAARRSLDFFGLSDLASRTLTELSYGQLRRVLFARAWVNRPRLLLLDEPFSGVDRPTRLDLMAHVADLVSSGTAVVMSTHHRSEWPACSTHELELSNGREVYRGPVRSGRMN
jgi:molybdate transport system ATP-binding protein